MDDLKYRIMQEIEKNSDVFKRVSKIRSRIRCPFCGDSQKDLRDAHMYLKHDYDNPNEPILYNCFLANCGAKGKVDKKFLELIGVKSNILNEVKDKRYNRIPSIKEVDIDIISGETDLSSPQVRYIEQRLGTGFEKEDYDRFKILWDLDSIVKYITNKSVRNTLPSNMDSINLLSDDRSTILSRGFHEKDNWRKIKIVDNGRSFYTLKSLFNLFTEETITVNIAEGVFDILSIYKNFNNGVNSVYIATLGPDYVAAVDYSILKGLIGSNVVLKIYIDNEIDEKRLKKQLKKYKYFFNKISIFRNIRYKDVGVKIHQIELVEYPV